MRRHRMTAGRWGQRLRQRPRRRTDGFTLIEVFIAIAILMFGLMGILAIFAHNARAQAEVLRKRTATILLYSVRDALTVAFETPDRSESTQSEGPVIIVLFDGFFKENAQDKRVPGGKVRITLPVKPAEGTRLEDLPEAVRWPKRNEEVYLLGRFIVADWKKRFGDNPSDDDLASLPSNRLGSFSVDLTFQNWRRYHRADVPGADFSGLQQGTPEGVRQTQNEIITDPPDTLLTGGDRGYVVTIRIYHNYQPWEPGAQENATMIAQERVILFVAPSFSGPPASAPPTP